MGEIAAAAARDPHRKRVWFFRTFIMENSSQTIHICLNNFFVFVHVSFIV